MAETALDRKLDRRMPVFPGDAGSVPDRHLGRFTWEQIVFAAVIVVAVNATWPLSWYLRHYRVEWSANLHRVDAPVVIIDREDNAFGKPLAKTYNREYFEIRRWWKPDWSALTLPKLINWMITRVAWSATGSSEAQKFRYKDLKPGMKFPVITINRGIEWNLVVPDGN